MCRNDRRCKGSHGGKRTTPEQKAAKNAAQRAAYAAKAAAAGRPVRAYTRRAPVVRVPAGVVVEMAHAKGREDCPKQRWVTQLPRNPMLARANAEALAAGTPTATEERPVAITPGYLTEDGVITERAYDALRHDPARLSRLHELVAQTWPEKENEK